MSLGNLFSILKGGSGSGNRGHAGIPGKRGGSAPKGGTAPLLTQSMLFDGENTSYAVFDKAAAKVSDTWDVKREDLDELAKEEKLNIKDFSDKKAKEVLANHYIRNWAGSSGGEAQTYAIKRVADKLKLKYKLDDRNSNISKYIKERPALDRALTSFGEAIYNNTQNWLGSRGIKEVAYRRGPTKDRLFTSWSTGIGGTRPESGKNITKKVINSKFIFSIPPTGFGTATESELVILPN